jgi:2-polyprenyl-6-methoxyphenol hydroxylase-like FAD-dependent oxidoreductase
MLQALLFQQSGLDVVVIDRRTSVNQHSRAIGIHPPGLSALHEVGLSDAFIEKGKTVTGGWAYVEGRPVGRMSFDSNPGRWKYPVIMPQHMTEDILEKELKSRDVPVCFGCNYMGFEHIGEYVDVTLTDHFSSRHSIRCRLLVGCDGKRSDVRSAVGSKWVGGKYRDRYVMGDFRDDGQFSDDAVINLHSDGLVESFPLPGGNRRWVARIQDGRTEDPDADYLQRAIKQRLSGQIDLKGCTMLSAFGIERWRADSLVSGRVVLAGDAAHVVSPIGGQGMNLGWIDSIDLLKCISEAESLHDEATLSTALKKYEDCVQKRAKAGIRRAWFNTVLGRSGQPKYLRLAATNLIVNTGMQKVFARRFTMVDL